MSLEQTQQHRRTVEAVHDVVNAMRAIAAGRIQNAQRALTNARRYQEVIVSALASLPTEAKSLPLPQSESGQVLLVVLTSEQPFCGAFNQEVLALAEKRLRELRADHQVYLVVAGQRGEAQMAAEGFLPDEGIPTTTSLQGMRDMVRRMAKLVDHHYSAGGIKELRVIYNAYHSVSEQAPTEEKLLPFQWSRIMPAENLKSEVLDHFLKFTEILAGLISEYIFINLYRIAAESFTSEQASRMVAMDGATRNAKKMLKSLVQLERRQRQEQITRQTLELLVARFAASSGSELNTEDK